MCPTHRLLVGHVAHETPAHDRIVLSVQQTLDGAHLEADVCGLQHMAGPPIAGEHQRLACGDRRS